MNCPHCNGELVPEPNNPGKYLCYNCKTRFNMNTTPSQKPASDQYDPFAGLDATGTHGTQPQGAPRVPQGAPYQPAPQGAPNGQLPKGTAIAALILGIVTIVLCAIPPLTILTGIAGIIVGIIAIRKASRGLAGGKGLAIAGTICAGIGELLSIALLVFSLLVIGAVSDELQSSNYMDDFYSYNGNYSYDDELDDLYSNTNTKGNSNTSSGLSDSIGSNSSSSAPSAPVTATGTWEDMTFSINGHNYQLGVTKVSDLMSIGITLDDATGYIVNPNQGFSLVDCTLASEPDAMMTISVTNIGSTACDISDCLVTGFTASAYGQLPNISACGVPFGASIQDVQQALGTPYDSYNGEGGYSSVTYQTEDYDKRLRLSSGGAGINDISMSLYL